VVFCDDGVDLFAGFAAGSMTETFACMSGGTTPAARSREKT
jgi:hypothetical protein